MEFLMPCSDDNALGLVFNSQNISFERVFPEDWIRRKPPKGVHIADLDESILDRLRAALRMLSLSVDVDPDIRSGVPVLKGTRFPVSHLLAELADDQDVSEIADAWDLDSEVIKKVLRGLSISLDRPFATKQLTSPDTHYRAAIGHDNHPVG